MYTLPDVSPLVNSDLVTRRVVIPIVFAVFASSVEYTNDDDADDFVVVVVVVVELFIFISSSTGSFLEFSPWPIKIYTVGYLVVATSSSSLRDTSTIETSSVKLFYSSS